MYLHDTPLFDCGTAGTLMSFINNVGIRDCGTAGARGRSSGATMSPKHHSVPTAGHKICIHSVPTAGGLSRLHSQNGSSTRLMLTQILLHRQSISLWYCFGREFRPSVIGAKAERNSATKRTKTELVIDHNWSIVLDSNCICSRTECCGFLSVLALARAGR